jgi:hypothetical protein
MMDASAFHKYLDERYLDQIRWYSSRSTRNKNFYSFFQWTVIVLSAVLPVLISVVTDGYKWVPLVISVLLAIGTGALRTFKFQEIWINYRTISETLKKEKHFYDANLDEYSNASDKEQVFVNRVENLISRENSLWFTTHSKKEDEKAKKSIARA